MHGYFSHIMTQTVGASWQITGPRASLACGPYGLQPVLLANQHARTLLLHMVHLMKLAVGIRDIAHLREVQARRMTADPPLRHQTRNAPRRKDEILDGGSLYWVIAGALLVRQAVLDITEEQWDDGSRCAGLVLDPALVQVEGRPVRAFQGWRYLATEDAPPDLTAADFAPDAIPPALRQKLRELCLI
jgi:hypothetical protein